MAIVGQGISAYPQPDDALNENSKNPVQNKVVAKEVNDLKSALKSGDEEDAIYHLGFYLDENGDLCQVEEETNNG